MPFGFGRKKAEAPPVEAASGEPVSGAPRRIRFNGLTEEWQLRGTMTITGRLLDALNKRETLQLDDVQWAPLDGSSPFEPAPGIRTADPYDLIVVIAGPDTLEAKSRDERSAHRIHKIAFDVALTVPPLRVAGTVQLHPGTEPEGLLDRATAMFVAITSPAIWVDGTPIELDPDAEAALVNRFYLRGVEQVDLATGVKPQRLPGAPLGGTTWRERS